MVPQSWVMSMEMLQVVAPPGIQGLMKATPATPGAPLVYKGVSAQVPTSPKVRLAVVGAPKMGLVLDQVTVGLRVRTVELQRLGAVVEWSVKLGTGTKKSVAK